VDTLEPHWHDVVQDDVDTKVDVCTNVRMIAEKHVVAAFFRKYHVFDLKKKEK